MWPKSFLCFFRLGIISCLDRFLHFSSWRFRSTWTDEDALLPVPDGNGARTKSACQDARAGERDSKIPSVLLPSDLFTANGCFHCARVSAFGCSRLLRSKAVHCPRYAVWLPRTLILQSSRPYMHTQINVHFTFYIEETIVHVRSDICVKHQTEKTPSRKWHSYSPYSQLQGCDPNVGRRLDLS